MEAPTIWSMLVEGEASALPGGKCFELECAPGSGGRWTPDGSLCFRSKAQPDRQLGWLAHRVVDDRPSLCGLSL